MEKYNDLLFATIVKYCGNNPGAISFFMESLSYANPSIAIQAFERMYKNNIREEKLYMLWNDCCDRNTGEAIYIMNKKPITEIIEHINYEHGRGIPF